MTTTSDYVKDIARAAQEVGLSLTEIVEPQDRYMTVNGLRLHYLDWGNEGKPPMLMLHGGSQTAHSWDFFALAVRPDFHVVALDQRGHGDSAWAPDGDYSLEAHQRDIHSFVQAIGLERFVLVGLSMGGRNSLVYTATHPERVRALVIVDVGPETQRAGRLQIRDFVTTTDELDSIEAFAQRVMDRNPHRSLSQLVGSLQWNLKQLSNGKWTWKYDKLLRTPGYRIPRGSREYMWECAAKISCPTLIVRGGDSLVLNREGAERFQQTVRGSQLVEVPDAGHTIPGDNPLGFEMAVRPFLARL
ncbi:MAG: alpha/beta hydrolase [Chloroflexi bacterium]|nr:alpha/beta hydrolase [Chloroflexota bacterium]